MSDIDGDKIVQFCEITGAEPEIAGQYLQVSNSDVQSAIAFFMENSRAPLDTGGAGATTNAASEPEVRAPIAPIRERLVDPLLESGSFQRQASLAAQQNAGADDFIYENDFYDDDDNDNDNDEDYEDNEDNGIGGNWTNISAAAGVGRETRAAVSSGVRGGRSGLSAGSGWTDIAQYEPLVSPGQSNAFDNLFAPPNAIMFKGNFDSARAAAQAKGRWILLSVVSEESFASMTMNRDLFKDKSVQEAIKRNFLFIQWRLESEPAQMHRNFYPFEDVPYTCIIDPVTGAREKVWSSTMQPLVFLSDVADFIKIQGSNPLVGPDVVHEIKDDDDDDEDDDVVVASTASSDTKNSKKKRYLTEEEELQRAINESMQGSSGGSSGSKRNNGVDDQVYVVDDDDDKTVEEGKDGEPEEEEETVAAGGVLGIVAAMNEEPAADAVRVQIRAPDGSRKVRKFGKSDTVRAIFAYVKADFAQFADVDFDLVNYRDSLASKLDSTIEDEKLGGASLTITLS